MKVLSIGLCLTLISIVSCQYVLSPTAVKGRRALMPIFKNWILALDKNFMKIYSAVSQMNPKAYAPLFPLQNDLMNQYENLNCSLNGTVPAGLQSFVLGLNSTLDRYTVYDHGAMQYFMTMPFGELQGPAFDARMRFQMSLQQILDYVTTPLPQTAPSATNVMVSEGCTTQLFQELRNLFEPKVNDIITNGTNLLALIPDLRVYLSSLVNDAKLEVEAVTKKLINCNQIQKIDEKQNCVTNMETYYTSNNNQALNQVVSVINKIQPQMMQLWTPLVHGPDVVYRLPGGFPWDVYNEVENLKKLCT